MNRHERRAHQAAERRAERKTVIADALGYLAHATPAAVAATLILPDGETLFITREQAEAATRRNGGGRC